MLIAIAMAAVGVALGWRFKVFALVPIALVGWLASFCVGMTRDDAIWSIPLTAFVAATALQLGYLAGIYFRMLRARARRHSNIITLPQRY